MKSAGWFNHLIEWEEVCFLKREHTKSMIRNEIKELLKKLHIFDFLKRIKDKFDKRNKALKVSGALCLEQLQKSFDSIDVDFWLVYGTLLGAVREGDFIGHDLDMDIGVWGSENHQAIERALTKNGFYKLTEFILDGEIVEETYSFKDITIDIFYYFMEGDQMIDYSFSNKIIKNIQRQEIEDTVVETGWIGFKQNATYTGFKKLEFKGLLFSVPKDTHKYLIENYGEDYMVVKKEWDVPNMNQINSTDIVVIHY